MKLEASQLLEAPAWPTRVHTALTGPNLMQAPGSEPVAIPSPRLPAAAASMAEVPADPGDTGTFSF